MDKAGAVEQDIDSADLGEGRFYGLIIQNIELAGLDARLIADFSEKRFVDVGGMDDGASLGESQCARVADALCCRRHDNDLAFESSHDATISLSVFKRAGRAARRCRCDRPPGPPRCAG